MLQAIRSTIFLTQDYPQIEKIHSIPTNNFILSTLTTSGTRTWNNPIINFLGSVWKFLTFFFLALVCWQSSKSVEHATENKSFLSNVKQKLFDHLKEISSDKVLCSRVIVTPGTGRPIVEFKEDGYQPQFPIETLKKAMPPGEAYLRFTWDTVELIKDFEMKVFNYEKPNEKTVLIKIYTYKTNQAGKIEETRKVKSITTSANPRSASERKQINELAGIKNTIQDDLA